ncbi:carbohydrate ABC transporter permease [Agromyces sp. NPDC056965]|uniref:carbohydrate ABC transporter permease n=1 Tax=Agromyces sp. NPDC056965 TaxID=3345983 RepID=UPI00362B5A1F
MTKRLAPRVATYLIAAAVGIVFIVPMILVLLNSFKSTSEASGFTFTLPTEWRFDNYLTVLADPGVAVGLVNSVIITVGVTGGAIIVCALAGYLIARRVSRVTTGLYAFLLAGLIAPFSFIPAIRVLQWFGLYNTHAGLILADIATQIPFMVLIFVSFVRQIPREVDEAAILDGAGPVRMFFQVVFPLLKPVTFTALVLLFTYAWNEFQNVLFLTSSSKTWTMPMTVYNFQGLHTFDYSLVSANLVITIIPVLIVYLFSQKYILSGMVAGAVKG